MAPWLPTKISDNYYEHHYPGYSIIKQKLSEEDMPRASHAEKFYYKTLDFLREK